MKLLDVELTSRKRKGLEHELVKAPIMPRMIESLESFLLEDHPSMVLMDPAAYRLSIAATVVCLAFYFGWRDETAGCLCWKDLVFDDTS